MHNRVQCQFTCGHWQVIKVTRAAVNRVELCWRCTEEKRIAKVNSHEWRIKCHDCSYGRWFAQSELEARRSAARHAQSSRGHTLMVVYDKVTEDGKGTYGLEKGARRKRTRMEDAGPVPELPPPF